VNAAWSVAGDIGGAPPPTSPPTTSWQAIRHRHSGPSADPTTRRGPTARDEGAGRGRLHHGARLCADRDDLTLGPTTDGRATVRRTMSAWASRTNASSKAAARPARDAEPGRVGAPAWARGV